MFFSQQSSEEEEYYERLLRIVGALSRLSSENDIPYLHYRMAEKIFCKAFKAIDLGRSDISLDAKKDEYGFGLKTFIGSGGQSLEKIAEFNKDRHAISAVSPATEKIKIIAEMRNRRLEATSAITNVAIENMLYHCVVRQKGMFLVCEAPMQLIDIDAIRLTNKNKASKNIIKFSDGIEEYSFNLSKSTLYKTFTTNPICIFDVHILEDPYQTLEGLLENLEIDDAVSNPIVETVCLPLYSKKGGIHVPEKSGLNQWNARGRPRDSDEVYIAIPLWIHKVFKGFFPPRDTSFPVRLPDGRNLTVSVCQDGGKALMSNPNKALGKWLLRTVLKLQERELATYEHLERIGIDSIEISKFSDGTFEMNFKEVGTFEQFESKYSTR